MSMPTPAEAKTIAPAPLFSKRAGHKRSEERTDIDADIKNRIGAVASWVAGRVERTDLGRNIRLKGAVANNERKQSNKKTANRRSS